MATVTLPARCAVAVICGDHLISQVYPAAVPVEVFFDSAVELLGDDLRRRGAPGLDPGVGYELQRANGSRLDIARTLEDLGIEDGMTLVLAPASEGDSFEPQCEALSTGLAGAGKKLFKPVTAETAAQTALAILGAVALTVLGLAVYARIRTDSIWPAVVTGTAGLGLGAGGVAVWRWWPGRRDLLTALVWLAVPLLTAGLTLGLPGALGAAHLFVAALATAVLTCAAVAVTHRNLSGAATVVTLSVIGGLIAGVRMFADVPAQRLGLGALVMLLVSLSISPTIALWAARIRPPHFGSVTGRDLFHRGDGLPIDVVAPVDDDSEDSADSDMPTDSTPGCSQITDAAQRANGVLTGICMGNAIALAPAIWATITPGGPHGGAAAALAVLFVVIFISRARAFADRRQAVTLVGGAVAGFCTGVVRYALDPRANSATALIITSALLLVFGAAALAAALWVPGTRFTPLVRMVAEWLELAAIVAALPLAAWISGLFTWVRMR
ncbi:MAG: type VII secretion integral membrane protein EccD [Mycobacterium sp.]